MVILKLTSGIGNQLFQYCFARRLAEINNKKLIIDTRFFNCDYAKSESRQFKLDYFQTKFELINWKIINLLRLLKFVPEKFKLHLNLNERRFDFDEELLKVKSKIIIVSGYFQSEKYFKPIRSTIRKELAFKNLQGADFLNYKETIEKCQNPVSIHIRRGDYVRNKQFLKEFGVMPIEYYQKAIELIASKVKDPTFVIFSDDYEWVIENFTIIKKKIVVKNTGIEADIKDMFLMSLSKHNIIANSSFSWWGAYLNSNNEKIVIAPDKWFKNKKDWDTKDLIPESWLRI